MLQTAVRADEDSRGGRGDEFFLAAVLLSVGYFVGIPQAVEDAAGGNLKNEKIQIIETVPGSPAEAMGIQIGDQIVGAVSEAMARL